MSLVENLILTVVVSNSVGRVVRDFIGIVVKKNEVIVVRFHFSSSGVK